MLASDVTGPLSPPRPVLPDTLLERRTINAIGGNNWLSPVSGRPWAGERGGGGVEGGTARLTLPLRQDVVIGSWV